jgi:O-antigen/teichoic acid export membrane protein
VSEPLVDASGEHDDIVRDAYDLRRGVTVNLFGYLIKIINPVLTWAVIILYGSHDYGFFVAAQAVVMVMLRVGLVGLDKGALWWTARQERGSPLAGLGGAALLVVVLSAAIALVTSVFAPGFAAWHGEPGAALGLRLMGVGIVPMALTELLVSAAAGRRRLEAQVWMRDGVGAVSLTLLGVALHLTGFGAIGLPVAFVLSRLITFVGVSIMVRRIAPLELRVRGERIPRALLRYSLPFWLSEIASAFLQRMDVLALTAMSTPAMVGIYGAVVQIANTLRQIRQTFDPTVLAMFSEIGARPSAQRLRVGFSYATALVIITQMPLYAFIFCFADVVMKLLGESYQQGALAVVTLAGFWMFNGVVGLNGHIVNGYGRSDLALVNMLVTIGVQAALQSALIPIYGLTGAALAVGLAYSIQNLLSVLQAYRLSRVWPYDRTVIDVLSVGMVASAGGVFVWFVGPQGMLARSFAFAAFAVLYAFGTLRLYRRGILSGTR